MKTPKYPARILINDSASESVYTQSFLRKLFKMGALIALYYRDGHSELMEEMTKVAILNYFYTESI